MDVREKLVALLKKFVPTVWHEDCNEIRHPKCDEIQCSECITDRLIHNGVTITPAVPGPREDSHNITELCFLNGKAAGREEVKKAVLEKLMEQKSNVKGICYSQLVELVQFVEGL